MVVVRGGGAIIHVHVGHKDLPSMVQLWFLQITSPGAKPHNSLSAYAHELYAHIRTQIHASLRNRVHILVQKYTQKFTHMLEDMRTGAKRDERRRLRGG